MHKRHTAMIDTGLMSASARSRVSYRPGKSARDEAILLHSGSPTRHALTERVRGDRLRGTSLRHALRTMKIQLAKQCHFPHQIKSPRLQNTKLAYPRAIAAIPSTANLFAIALSVSISAASNLLLRVSVVLPRGNSTPGWSTCRNLHSGSQPSFT